jgi:hypothetical protein
MGPILDIYGTRCSGFDFEVYDLELCGPCSWQPRYLYCDLSPLVIFDVYTEVDVCDLCYLLRPNY